VALSRPPPSASEALRRELRPRRLPRGLDALSAVAFDPWSPVAFDWGSPHPWFLTPWVQWEDLSVSASVDPLAHASVRVGMAWVRLAKETVYPPTSGAPDLSDYRVPRGSVVGFCRAVEILPRPGAWAISVSGVPGRHRALGRVASSPRDGAMPSPEVRAEAWTTFLQHLASFDLLPIFVGQGFDEVPSRALLRWMERQAGPLRPPPPKKVGHHGWMVPEVAGVREERFSVRRTNGEVEVRLDPEGCVRLGPWRLTQTASGYPRWVRYWEIPGPDGVPDPWLAVALSARGPQGPWTVELAPFVVEGARVLEGALVETPAGPSDALRAMVDEAIGHVGLVGQDRGEPWRWPLPSTAMASFSSIVEEKTSSWASPASEAPVSSPKRGRRSRR
jgi:hypothetical protein